MNLGLMPGLSARCVVGIPIDPAVLFADGEVGGWYDPSDLSTLFQDSAGTTPVTAAGQPVGLMLDKSGNGNHVSQATAGSRPTLQEDSNGKLHLLFDGTDDWLGIASLDFTSTDEVTLIAGVRKLSDAASGTIAELGTSNFPGFFGLRTSPNQAGVPQTNYGFVNAGTGISLTRSATFAAPTTNVVAGLGKISTDTSQIRVDGALSASGELDQGNGNYSLLGFSIGARINPNTFLNGRIYGVIARGKLTSGAQLAGLEAYMAAQTGVTHRTNGCGVMNPLGFGARLVAGFVWLLSTAAWNDNGAWIDTATWQDTI